MAKTVMYAGREISWKDRPLEKLVQGNCVRLLKLAGFVTGSTSQYRASRTEEGIPDLHLFHHRLGCSGWWETKRPGEELTEKQVRWRAHCLATRTLHGWGTDEDLKLWLVVLGLGHITHGVFGLFQPSKHPDGGTVSMPHSAELQQRIWAASCLYQTPAPVGPP